MENKAKMERHKVINWILNIVIIIMVIVFVVSLGKMVIELKYAFSPMYSVDNLHYNMESERYFEMVSAYHYNTQAGFEGSTGTKEYYGVAKYYEAASLYKAYTVAGNTEMANHFLEKMNQVESEMGSWSIAKNPIKAQLGIE